MTKPNRIEIITDEGRVVVKYAKKGKHFVESVQDDGKTIKYFEVEDEEYEFIEQLKL